MRRVRRKDRPRTQLHKDQTKTSQSSQWETKDHQRNKHNESKLGKRSRIKPVRYDKQAIGYVLYRSI